MLLLLLQKTFTYERNRDIMRSMKNHTILFISSIWIIFISLLAIPRGMKTILVILGAVLVFLVAYGMLQKRRIREQERQQENEPLEVFLDNTTNEIIETIMNDREIIADVEAETELTRDFLDALGENSTIESFEEQKYGETYTKESESIPEKPKRVSREKPLKEASEITHESGEFTI